VTRLKSDPGKIFEKLNSGKEKVKFYSQKLNPEALTLNPSTWT